MFLQVFDLINDIYIYIYIYLFIFIYLFNPYYKRKQNKVQ